MELNRGCCSMCWLNCHDDDSKATKPKWIFGRANKQNHAYCKCPFQYQSVRVKRSYWIKCFPRWRRIHFQIHINGWDMRMHTQTRIAHMVFFVCVVYSDIAYKQKRSLQNPSIDFPLSMYPATTVEVWECRNVSARVSRTTTITNSNFPCLRYWTLNTNIHSHTHTHREYLRLPWKRSYAIPTRPMNQFKHALCAVQCWPSRCVWRVCTLPPSTSECRMVEYCARPRQPQSIRRWYQMQLTDCIDVLY